ncbi:hypothetical protein PUN28_017155 [Cardiocondyla obscurior]|uniref:Uncharacterized protein n=1 Tax=Cardiocondyla obscurior TaxID=286306 RepID=A0AAW2EM75_9HYME
MVFAIAIDSDVHVNTNHWHCRSEWELDAAIASGQYCLCQNADVSHRLPATHGICLSTFVQPLDRQNKDLLRIQGVQCANGIENVIANYMQIAD